MIEKRSLVVLLLLGGLLAGVSSVHAAQANSTDPNMVYVPVAVTGAKNAYVGGLTKENFQLKEDGKEQAVSFFSPQDQPFEINIILALSSLQRGRADLTSAKIREAVEEFLKAGNPANKYAIEELPFGSNGVFDAMSRHVRGLSASTNPRKAIIVVTDGFDSGGGDPGRAVQEYAKKEDVPIYIFYAAAAGQASDDILNVGRGREIFLESGAIYEELARMTGGRLYQAEADTQLRSNLQTLAAELKNQYVLGFVSTNAVKNDKWRKLEIKIVPPPGQKDLKTKVKDRYFVAK